MIGTKNSKNRFCGDRDEAIDHIMSKWSKFAQKSVLDKTQLERKGKGIHGE